MIDFITLYTRKPNFLFKTKFLPHLLTLSLLSIFILLFYVSFFLRYAEACSKLLFPFSPWNILSNNIFNFRFLMNTALGTNVNEKQFLNIFKNCDEKT